MPKKPTPKRNPKSRRAPRAPASDPSGYAVPMEPMKPEGSIGAIQSYRHAAKRKNIPPAGLASQGKLREAPKMQFEYNPHLPPVLRFDPTGAPDKLPRRHK